MGNRVIHFEVQADDVDRAKSFYEKTFGWKVMQTLTRDTGGMDYWLIETGRDDTPGINGGMYRRGKDKIYTYDCTIAVEDIDQAIEIVKKNGGKITREKDEMPGIGWFASALDTEGNKIGLMQPAD